MHLFLIVSGILLSTENMFASSECIEIFVHAKPRVATKVAHQTPPFEAGFPLMRANELNPPGRPVLAGSLCTFVACTLRLLHQGPTTASERSEVVLMQPEPWKNVKVNGQLPSVSSSGKDLVTLYIIRLTTWGHI
jgi:hypothetical protein